MLPLFYRRTLFTLLAAGSLALSATPSVHAKAGAAASDNGGTPIDINFFYDTLKDDGTWYNTADYGDVWQPHIAYKSETWRPYTDGYWSYTDGGWMFVSNENFGWAVYHYGRWTRLKDIGWAWVPGTDWAPAWVTWRASKPDGNGPPAAPDGSPAPAAVDATTTTAPDASAPAPVAASDDKNPVPPDQSSAAPPPAPAAGGPPPTDNYIGWAPLPPERAAYTAIDYSYGPTVDVDFGIDPYDYCFTDVRYFGAPYIATVLFDPFQSYYCCGGSVNITNIYYSHDGGYRGFYAGGPNYDRFRGVTQHDIPRYNLHQESGTAARDAIRNKQFNRIKGNSLGVPAPRFSPQGVGPDGRVKFTRAAALAKAEVNHGAPAAAANNPAYKQAQESFAKQGNAYRAAHPDAPGSRAAALRSADQGGAVPETAPKLSTTPRAQEEEREARRTAGEKVPESDKTAAGPAEARHENGQPGEATHHETAGGEPERAQKEGAHEAEHPAGTRTAKSRRSRSDAVEGRRAASAGRQRAVASESRAREAAGPRQPKAAAPRMVAAPRPQGGGGGGGKQEGGDKKKK